MDKKNLDTKVFNLQLDEYPKTKTQRRNIILSKLRSSIANLLQADTSELDIYTSFLELGGDSLMLIDFISHIENTYGIYITTVQLFEELTTIDALASYINQNLPSEEILVDSTAVKSKAQTKQTTDERFSVINTSETLNNQKSVRVSSSAVERIMQKQLQVVSQVVSEQLDIMRKATE